MRHARTPFRLTLSAILPDLHTHADPACRRLHHGLGSTHNYHQTIAPALSSPPHNYHVLTYDAISCGLSSLATGPQTISTVADDVIAVLDALSMKKAVFVGHSFAGIVAAHLAATQAERFLGVVMLGPVLPSEGVSKIFEQRVGVIEESTSPAVGQPGQGMEEIFG